MGDVRKMRPVTLRHSGFGSVALGVLVVGAGAVPGGWTAGGWTVAEPADQAVVAPVPIGPPSVDTDIAAVSDWSQGLVVPALTSPTQPATPSASPVADPLPAPVADPIAVSDIAPPAPLLRSAAPVETGLRIAAVVTPADSGTNAASNGAVKLPSQPPQTVPATALATPPAPAVTEVAPAPGAPVARLALALPEVPPVTAQAAEIAPDASPAPVPAPPPVAPLAPVPAPPALLAGVTRFDLARLPKPAPAPRLATARPAAAQVAPVRLTQPRNRVPLRAPGGRYKVTPKGLEFDIGVVVAGAPSGRVPLLIDATDTISVRLADVLGAVRPLMDEAMFARLSGAASAQEYVTFAKLRQAGIDLRYDAGGDRLVLSMGSGE